MLDDHGRSSRSGQKHSARLPHRSLHVLEGVNSCAASRDIREAIRSGKRVAGLVPPVVEEYIFKEGLYRTNEEGQIRR